MCYGCVGIKTNRIQADSVLYFQLDYIFFLLTLEQIKIKTFSQAPQSTLGPRHLAEGVHEPALTQLWLAARRSARAKYYLGACVVCKT